MRLIEWCDLKRKMHVLCKNTVQCGAGECGSSTSHGDDDVDLAGEVTKECQN